MNARRCIAACLLGLCAIASGCRESEQIDQYQVPKQHVLDQINGPPNQSDSKNDAMLAAIVLTDGQGWFFKMAGPREPVLEARDDFEGLVASLEFDEQQGPKWKLPSGWQQQDGSGMRFATLMSGTGADALETSVTRLPRNEADDSQYLLSNINRWRGQMGLRPIGVGELAKQSRQVKFQGGTATVIEIEGKLAGSDMRGPLAGGAGPFASGRGPFADLPAEERPAGAGSQRDAGLEFETPQGWAAGRVGGMRKAAFVVSQGDRQVEITVIDLAESAGDLLDNVNRWRGQVGLAATNAEQLEADARQIEVGSSSGHYVELVGERQTILAVIVKQGGKAWFLKLMGDPQLAEREKQRFEQFVQSVEFDGS